MLFLFLSQDLLRRLSENNIAKEAMAVKALNLSVNSHSAFVLDCMWRSCKQEARNHSMMKQPFSPWLLFNSQIREKEKKIEKKILFLDINRIEFWQPFLTVLHRGHGRNKNLSEKTMK